MTRNPVLNRLIICLLAVLLLQCVAAQDTAVVHTPVNIKPTTDFDQRFYYPPGNRQNIWGYRGGILINDRYKLGMGGYFMNQYAEEQITSTDFTQSTSEQAIVNRKLYLGTVYYEPYLLRRNLWETSLLIETGYGRTVNTYTSKSGNEITERRNGLLIPAGIGLSVNIKLPAFFNVACFRWIGINAMTGYRLIVYQQDKKNNYSGAYWSLSGAIFLDRVFEDFHSWKKQRDIARGNKIPRVSY